MIWDVITLIQCPVSLLISISGKHIFVIAVVKTLIFRLRLKKQALTCQLSCVSPFWQRSLISMFFPYPFLYYTDSKVHGANMGPILGRQDPGGPHVGPLNLAIWVYLYIAIIFLFVTSRHSSRKHIEKLAVFCLYVSDATPTNGTGDESSQVIMVRCMILNGGQVTERWQLHDRRK